MTREPRRTTPGLTIFPYTTLFRSNSKIGKGRYELYAGDFKLNIHIKGKELTPHAAYVQVGSGDLCFEIEGDIEDVKKTLEESGMTILLGVVERTGVRGLMHSIYLNDPDGNLVELCSYE